MCFGIETAVFYELKQNITRDIFKKYFHGEKDKKDFSYKYCCQ